MKSLMMYRDRDVDPKQALPSNHADLTQDLALGILFDAMALGDEFLRKVSEQTILSSLTDGEDIRYRQSVLRDCLKNVSVVREIYQISIESIENKKKDWLGIFSTTPSGVLFSGRRMLQMFLGLLIKLKRISDAHSDKFESEGFTRFFSMIKQEMSEEYLASVQSHLSELEFRDGFLFATKLVKGNENAGYVLCKPINGNKNWFRRIFRKNSPVYTFRIPSSDAYGATALSEIKDAGTSSVANAVAQSADHIDTFFETLRFELAFYIGCINLYEQLAQIGEPITFPMIAAASERRHSFTGLYDACLALTIRQQVIGNSVSADDKELFIITGANQGGKSTFLRSIGIAQLMMQCGMFVPAESSYCANICSGLFTHYKREEDATMKRGKLDEEMARMSTIVDNLSHDCMVLFNESFAATNEREGSEIAKQIISGRLEKRVKVLFVTHLYEFAHGMWDKKLENACFFVAERLPDGTRTFRLMEGEPLQTSYGDDLFKQVFKKGNQLFPSFEKAT